MTRSPRGRSAALALADLAVDLRENGLPPHVAETARCHLLYALACAAAAGDAAGPAQRLARGTRPAEATLLVVGEKVAAEQAAFANGALLHARAQDDTHLPSQCHLGAAVVPAALAAGEAAGASGRDFLAAMVAGYEIAAAVGEELAADAIPRGFRASGIFGCLGAAGAASSVLGVDREGVAGAISLATSFASGLNETWLAGSSDWIYHLALAARNGVLAARLAAAGERGPDRALEGSAGFASAFAGRDGWAPIADWALGERWRTLEVIYKPYPVCNITQNPVRLAAEIAATHALDPDDVQAARLWLNADDRDYPGVLNPGPYSGVGATLMSAEFCVAMGLRDHTASVHGLARWDDPVTTALVGRVEVLADNRLPELGARLEVETADGRRFTAEGLPDGAAFSGGWGEVVAFAHRLAGEMMPGISVDRLAAAVAGIEEHEKLTVLTEVSVCP